MYKKIISFMYLVIIGSTLNACGCFMVPSTDFKSLEAIFSKILIDNECVLINEVDDDYNRTEIIDIKNKSMIRIHVIENSAHLHSPIDSMISITPDWIFHTDTMQKTPNFLDASNKEERIHLLETYTELYEENLFTNENLVAIVLSLKNASFHRSGGLFVLKGENTSVSNLPEGVNAMIEIRYRDNRLLEVHFSLEHDFRSTKQESNYISGTHWYFGDFIETEFPPLNDFTEHSN